MYCYTKLVIVIIKPAEYQGLIKPYIPN